MKLKKNERIFVTWLDLMGCFNEAPNVTEVAETAAIGGAHKKTQKIEVREREKEMNRPALDSVFHQLELSYLFSITKKGNLNGILNDLSLKRRRWFVA